MPKRAVTLTGPFTVNWQLLVLEAQAPVNAANCWLAPGEATSCVTRPMSTGTIHVRELSPAASEQVVVSLTRTDPKFGPVSASASGTCRRVNTAPTVSA